MEYRVLVTGGGTGGHLFPGIALATGLRRRLNNCRLLFIGTPRHLDRRTLARYDFELETIECMGLKGMGLTRRLRSLAQLPAAVREAGGILKRFRPDLVFGVGGYVTGPVLLAAKLRRIPVCIHEQNSVPGLANRMLGRIADRIFLSLPCRYAFPAKKTLMVGNPVRTEILKAAERKTDRGGADFTILVLGGSQGAHRINMLMVEAAKLLAAEQVVFRIIHQSGITDEETVRRGYAGTGAQAEVSDFIQDMAAVYGRADLVVSRAGATTLAELAVMGLPALLVPYPFAADDHQMINGRYFEEGGGALVLPEGELSGTKLAGEIRKLARDRDRLDRMATAMKTMARPDAVERIIDACLEMMGGAPVSREA